MIFNPLGLHGFTHKVDQFYSSSHSVVQEFKQTRKTIKRVTNKDTVLARTPYGSIPHLKLTHFRAIQKAGYRLWDWNVDSLDWKYKNKFSVFLVKKHVKHLEKAKIHPVILMHDLKETARFLPNIIVFKKKWLSS